MKTTSIVAVMLFAVLAGCKNESTASAVRESTASAAPSDISYVMVECKISDLATRNTTTTEELNSAQLMSLSSVSIKIPKRDQEGSAQIAFSGATELKDLIINEALDLYDRRGRIAQVSGGVFKENYAPVMTTRIFFDTTNAATSGFVELSWYDANGKAVDAKANLACRWGL